MLTNVHIAIPSRGRWDNMQILQSLPKAIYEHLNVYVDLAEHSQYRSAIPNEINLISVPESGIRYKRQFIFDHSPKPKILMLDDDLKFWYRTQDGKLWRPALPIIANAMLEEINTALDVFAAVGVADKFMGQARPRQIQKNVKFNQVMGFNLDLMPNPRPKFWPEYCEDYNMILQLLTSGCPTAVLTEWAKSEVPWAKGGCSLYRTPEHDLAEHRKLEEYWGTDIFRITSLPTPKYPQLKLRISWKKAAQRGGLC